MRVVILLLVVAACQPDGRGPGIDGERAMEHVNALVALGPRPAGARRYRSERRWVFGVLIGLALIALAGGIALSLLSEPSCTAEQFTRRRLACEGL